MGKFMKSAFVAFLAAAAALLMGASMANADITASPAGAMTATSLGTVDLIGEGGLIDITISCDVTLTGSVNASIADPNGALGAVTGGSARNCDNGSATLLVSSANTWPLTLVGSPDLTNTLARLEIRNVQFSVTVLGQTCLYTGNIPLTLDYTSIGGGRFSTGLITVNPHSLGLASGSFLCPTDGILDATFALSPLQTLVLV